MKAWMLHFRLSQIAQTSKSDGVLAMAREYQFIRCGVLVYSSGRLLLVLYTILIMRFHS
jgi:hypothetical protein